MKSVAPTAASAISSATQLEVFIAKFEPATAKLIRECRAEARTLLLTAIELIYNSYNFLVMDYRTTKQPSRCSSRSRQRPMVSASRSTKELRCQTLNTFYWAAGSRTVLHACPVSRRCPRSFGTHQGHHCTSRAAASRQRW